MEELKEIGKRRKKLGLTQTELARLSGVSQSLIAKLERGIIDIAYTKAQKIFKALEGQEKKEEVIAQQIMTKSVKSIKKTDKVQKAAEIMRELRISQLPVLKDDVCVGSITEASIMEALQNKKDLKEIKVEEIMEEAFPSLSPKASVDEVMYLFQRNFAVLIMEKGKIVGIVTKADLLKTLGEKISV